MTITVAFNRAADVVRLLDALRDAGAGPVDDALDKHARRAFDEVGRADGLERRDVASQASRVWAWLTPGTREALTIAEGWGGPEAETLQREVDEVAKRFRETRHRTLAEAAANIDR